jgi:hypothetical protein
MNKKGMTPMDMCSLLTSLEAIKHVCTYEKGEFESSEKSSNKGKGRNALIQILQPGFPKKSILRSIATCAISMGACMPCTTLMIVIGLRRKERRNPISVPLRKAEGKVIPQTRTLCS